MAETDAPDCSAPTCAAGGQWWQDFLLAGIRQRHAEVFRRQTGTVSKQCRNDGASLAGLKEYQARQWDMDEIPANKGTQAYQAMIDLATEIHDSFHDDLLYDRELCAV